MSRYEKSFFTFPSLSLVGPPFVKKIVVVYKHLVRGFEDIKICSDMEMASGLV